MLEINEIRSQWAQQRPDIDTEPMALIGRIVQLAALLEIGMTKTFERYGLNLSSFDVLATLLRAGPPHALSPKQLLASTMVTSGTMTNRIDQLVKENHVVRIKNPEDKRSVLVQLTESGRLLIDDVVSEHVDTQARLVEGLSKEQRDSLIMQLDLFLSNLKLDHHE